VRGGGCVAAFRRGGAKRITRLRFESNAMLQVITEASEPLSTRQIKERVEALLGSPVSPSSVKECLKRESRRL
jgi:hypothetical protein